MKRTSSHFGLVLLMSLLLVIMYSSFTSGQKVPALPCRTDGDCLVLGAGNWVCTNKVCSDSSNGGSTSPSSIANSPTGTGPTQTASSTPNSSSNSSTSSFPLWAVIFIVVVAAGLLLALGVFLYWNKIRRASEPGIPGRSRRGGGGGGDGSNKTVSHLNNNSNSLTMVNMVDKSLSSSSAAPFVAVPPSVEPQQQQMAAFHEQQMSDMMMQQQQHHHHLPAMYVHQALPPAPLSIVAAATSNAPTARPKKDYSEAAQFLRMSRVDADSPSSARSTPAAAAPSPYYMSSPAIAAAANPPLSAGGKMYSEPEEMAPTGQMAMFQPSAPPPIQRKSIDSDESILYDDSNVDNASNASYVSYGYVPSPYAGQQQRF